MQDEKAKVMKGKTKLLCSGVGSSGASRAREVAVWPAIMDALTLWVVFSVRFLDIVLLIIFLMKSWLNYCLRKF